MAGTAKCAGLVVVAVLVVGLTGACAKATGSVAAEAAPSVVSTPTPPVTPTASASVSIPSDPRSMDLSDGVLKSRLYTAGNAPAVRCV
ncbi:MAG TPA: hypothetical protein VFI00_21050, partial [Kribbella sp.]|nr:hypothetical protein [Kribbella sp.]